jgi:NTF2-related export protein 1/2
MYDERREFMHNFYKDISLLLWNGTLMKGKETISSFFQQLPHSEHSIQSFDCQPLLADWNDQTKRCSILVTVQGDVYFGSKVRMGTRKRHYQPFCHQLTLSPEESHRASSSGQPYFVQYDCIRFISTT